MKVAILNRTRSGPPGGDLVEIDNRMAALQRLGVKCEYAPASLDGFDLVHIWHCNWDWSRENFLWARRHNIPQVATPMYYPHDFGMSKREIATVLNTARVVMPYSQREGDELCKAIGRNLRLTIIPNGTSAAFHAADSGDRIGVCSVAARSYGNPKNTAVVAEACRLAGLPFTLISGLTPEEMPAAYRHFKVFINASESERMSLVIGEALCSGCRVLATSENWGNEWYPGIRTIDPHYGAEEMARQISAAYNAEGWDWTPNNEARHLTWDGIAPLVVEAYQKALA